MSFLRFLFIVFLFVAVFSPISCEKAFQLSTSQGDAVSIFNEVWQDIDEHYALFAVKNIDWDSVHQQFSPRIVSGMPESELFGILNEMLQTLRDGHVVLFDKSDTALYVDFYRPFPVNFSFDNIVHTYLKDNFTRSGPLIFKLVSETGYIYYPSFSENLTPETIDAVLKTMSASKGIILDLRSNTGGHSENANLLFSRFIAAATTVKYEKGKNGSGHDAFAPAEPLLLQPSGYYFNKPLVILTNRLCYSACNDFVAYTKTISNARQVGDRTGGGGGIPQAVYLSNGWKLQYTATETLDASLHPIEEGIEPDEYREISTSDEAAGKDPILEYAFSLLQ